MSVPMMACLEPEVSSQIFPTVSTDASVSSRSDASVYLGDASSLQPDSAVPDSYILDAGNDDADNNADADDGEDDDNENAFIQRWGRGWR